MLLSTTNIVLILSLSLSQKQETAEAAPILSTQTLTFTDCILIENDYNFDKLGRIDALANESSLLDYVTNSCREETLHNSGDCSSDCKTKLANLNNITSISCCIDSQLGRRLHPLSSELWHTLCGVETPRVCKSKQSIDETSTEIPEPDNGTDFRELVSPRSAAYCQSLENDAYCLSGYAQLGLDFKLKCGKMFGLESLYTQYSTCAKSESGALCGSLTASFIKESKQINEACHEALSSDNAGCSQECSGYLTEIKRKIGCCINEDFSRFNRSLSYIFQDNLWSRCGLQAPSKKCRNHSLDFSRYNATGECNVSDLPQRYSSQACTDNGPIQRAINTLLKNETCYKYNLPTAHDFSQQCLVAADGQYCVPKVLNLTTASNFDQGYPDLQLLVQNLGSSCQDEVINRADTCSSSCRSKLEQTRRDLGCCVNFFNQSTSDKYNRRLLSYTLWDLCDVNTPGVCDNTVSINTS